jgi:glucuronate isomerase
MNPQVEAARERYYAAILAVGAADRERWSVYGSAVAFQHGTDLRHWPCAEAERIARVEEELREATTALDAARREARQ